MYRGAGVGSLPGRYVFGDFGSGWIFARTPGSGDRAPDQLLDTPLSISSFAEGENGEALRRGLRRRAIPDRYRLDRRRHRLSGTVERLSSGQ